MIRLANHILSVANNQGIRVTNLMLQKTIYFTLGRYIEKNGKNSLVEDLYVENLEAWPYGPVSKTVYNQYKHLGSMWIDDIGVYDKELSVMDEVIKSLLNEDVFELVRKSHENPFWAQKENDILSGERGIKYTLEDLENDFILQY